ncbi:MAG: 4Fe-4S dicluster domain-containing protein [Roseburia sp.]|nr:4Fe-4S dicluster domain-containing protein [Roseburia sp.]
MDKNIPVILDSDKCNGCVNCMKRCPTEAIRVRGGKAMIMYDRCVGCGECVRVCPTQAKLETPDPLSAIEKFKYKIAVVSAAIYGQFANLGDPNYVRDGLIALGFDDVVDVGECAAAYSQAIVAASETGDGLPFIGPVCPVVTRLIQLKYEHLIRHIPPVRQPERIAVKLAVKRAAERGLDRKDVGVFLIAPCAADILKFRADPDTDGVLSIKGLYVKLLAEMNKIKKPSGASRLGAVGVMSGANIEPICGFPARSVLVADGIDNVLGVLEELEHDKLGDVKYLQLYACHGGCVGGTLNIENPFLARNRLVRLADDLGGRETAATGGGDIDISMCTRTVAYEPKNIFKLDDDRAVAMKKAMEIKRIYASLPHMDCGACGAPCCMAFAEDIVKGVKAECKYVKVQADGGGET